MFDGKGCAWCSGQQDWIDKLFPDEDKDENDDEDVDCL